MNRRLLPAAVIVLLLALLLGAGWWWLGAGGAEDDGLGGDGTAPLAGQGEPDGAPLPGLPPATDAGQPRAGEAGYEEPALPTPAAPGTDGGDAEEAAPAPEREENDARYTRLPLRYRPHASTNRLPPTFQPIVPRQLRLVFEDDSPVKGAEMRHDGRPAGTTGAQGYLRPLPTGPIDWFARSPWLWLGRRLWFKERRDAPAGQDGYVQVMWSAGRQVTGVLRDRTGTPVAGAALTFVQDLPNHRLAWTAATDPQGRFAVADVSPSPLRVELQGEGLIRHAVPNWIPEGAPGATSTVDLHTARGRKLTVELRAPPELQFHGGSVEFAYAWPELVPGRRSERTLRATVPPSGRTTILIARDIDLKLTASGQGLAPRTILGFGAKLPSRITVPLREDGHLARPWVPVHCFDATTDRPLKPAVILARPADVEWAIGLNITTQVVRATCHPPDRPDFKVLDLRDLDAGDYDFFFYQPGYAPVTLRARATRDGLYPPYAVPMQRGGDAPKFEIFERGTGEPIAHAALGVEVEPTQGPFLHDLVFGGLYPGRKGVITPALPPGTYVVRPRASGFTDGEERVTLTGNDHRQMKLVRAKR